MTDFSRRYRQKQIEDAIKGEVRLKLHEILPLLSKNRLTSLASSMGLHGRSKMNKSELEAALPPYLLDVNHLEFVLLMSREDEFRFYLDLLHEPYIQNDEITPGVCRYLMALGILFSFFNEDKLYFVIPEEVKGAHRQLDWDRIVRIRARQQLVLRYVEVTINLYGVCRPELLIDIFNEQNDHNLSMSELEEICEIHLVRMQTFQWIHGYLASDYFELDDLQEFHGLLMNIQNKPRYVPDKEELLKHADDLYYEKTPQLMQLRMYILNQLCDDSELVDEIISDIQLACSMEEPLQEIIHELERRNIAFESMDQVKRFADLVVEVYNNTRLWSNCGYTPIEMRALTGASVNRPVPGQRVVPLKVGRNEPCPCGSGLKHKKCSGK